MGRGSIKRREKCCTAGWEEAESTAGFKMCKGKCEVEREKKKIQVN